MPTQRNVNDLTFTIPADPDAADMPAIFETYTDGMPAPTSTGGLTTFVTSEDTNKIFEFSTAEGSDPTETTVNVTGTGFWKAASGKNYGMQFGIVTGNDVITFTTDEDGVSFQPFDTVAPDSFAIVTRVSDTLWLVAGGGSPYTPGPFIMTSSILGKGDYYA